MDPSRFVELSDRERESLADLTCSICHKICIDAMRCPDDHFFCRLCIQTHLDNSSSCPVDNEHLTTRDLLPSKLVERLVSRLSVRCDNSDISTMRFAVRRRLGRPTGCRWTGPYSELKAHLKTCPFRSVKCVGCHRDDIPAIGLTSHQRICLDRYERCDMCQTMVLAREMNQHQSECPAANIICPNHCLIHPGVSTSVTLVRRRNLEEHLSVCPKQIVKCQFSDWGCGYKGFKGLLGSHATRGLTAHVEFMRKEVMRLCQRTTAIKEELDHLRDLVNAFRESAQETTKLRKELGELKTEMSSLKRLFAADAESQGQTRRTKIRKLEDMEHSDPPRGGSDSWQQNWHG